MKKYKVLFVCLGNICRSPAAEGILKTLVKKEKLDKDVYVDSAGTSGYHTGDLPDSRMRQHAAKRGYNLNSLSRKFKQSDFYNFDIIIAMDDSNYHNILDLAPDLESENQVYRMVDFLEQLSSDHVPDPYYLGADGFELVLDLLEDSCQGLLDKLKNNEL